MKVAVIYNPYAGRERGGVVAATIETCLGSHGLEVELHATQQPGDATQIAKRVSPMVDTVVAVGGDGTINEVVNGMANSHARLGIVSAGTVNVLSLELGLPSQVERACSVIAGGKTKAMDVGWVDDRRFLLMMGAGIDAQTIKNLDPKSKKRYRELAFISTGLRTGLSAQPQIFRVKVNGLEYLSTFLVAGNSRNYGGRFGITTDADPTDGLLDVLIFRGLTIGKLSAFWLGVPTGLHIHHKDVVYVKAEELEVFPFNEDDQVWYQTDGELAGTLPAKLGIDHHALDILVP